MITTKLGSSRASKRHPSGIQKREHLFQIRKSLAEYVDQELDNFGVSLFYQRVYILARNIRDAVITAHRESLQSTATVVTTGTVGTAVTAGTATLNTTDTTILTADVPIANLGGSERTSVLETQSGKRSITMIQSEDTVPTDALITVTKLDGDVEKQTKVYEFSDNDESIQSSQQDKAAEVVEVEKPRGFFEIFMDKLLELNGICQKKIYTQDRMGGLFLFMGEYTILILEGCEDMIGAFCIELNEIAAEFWSTNRIFQVEDKLSEIYFERLIARQIPAAFINEKFPTSTPNDEYLMSKQHLVIKQKIKTICDMLADDLRIKYEPTEGEETPKKRVFSTTLALDPYRKLLPEMQRIDLVLNSNRFYSPLESFANIYGTTPLDDEILYWPIPYNYLPPNIFRRTPFDVNLTFGDYGVDKEKRGSSVVSNVPDFGLDELEEGLEDGGAKKEEAGGGAA